MKNINEIAKSNLEEFDNQFGNLWTKVNDVIYKVQTESGLKELPIIISPEAIKQFLNQSQQNIISAFEEMVEELPNVEVETIQGNKRTKVELKAKFTKDLLSSLTEELKHGAGSNCDIDMCPECEKLDNNFSN